jgi:hypothetical protein
MWERCGLVLLEVLLIKEEKDKKKVTLKDLMIAALD